MKTEENLYMPKFHPSLENLGNLTFDSLVPLEHGTEHRRLSSSSQSNSQVLTTHGLV